METPQDTPVATGQEDVYVNFGVRVFLQTPLDVLASADAGVFFEFKHFKPKGGYASTRCWSFMEMDEIKEGTAKLELYKKPADPNRRKINAHSVKPYAYLYVRLTLHSL